jgi:hypothetical protein
MMEMTIGHAVLGLGALNAILHEEPGKERKLPFKVKLRLTRMKDILEKDIQAYESERVRLVGEYGDEVEKDGEKVLEVKDPEKLEKFYKELEDVLKTPTTGELLRLSQDELKLIEDIDIDISENQLKVMFEFLIEKE